MEFELEINETKKDIDQTDLHRFEDGNYLL